MAGLWIVSLLMLSAAVLVVIRRRFGPGYVAKQVADPLAIVERSLLDAIGELAPHAPAHLVGMAFDDAPFDATSGPGRALRDPPRSDLMVFVNPFESACDALGRIPHGYIASLGPDAAAAHRRLLAAMRAWNVAAGRIESAHTLLPVVMAAHLAAGELARHVLPQALDDARDRAHRRILYGLVAPVENVASTFSLTLHRDDDDGHDFRIH